MDRSTDWSYDRDEEDTTNAFAAQHVGKYLYEVEFSDNDGDFYCHLEHGPTFDAVPHVKFSHH